jgi:hypothetical protein
LSLSLPARVYDGQKYVEIVPIRKRYKGKVIRSRALRWYNFESWENLVKAVTKMQYWMEQVDAWDKCHGRDQMA